ncbi:acetate--CoA ligase [Luminiphilus sp.]|nr:acetate--CoA ligase [Luminiphilus sp.]MDB2691478.1 acetate--CoA ligase [Luminiphilus sp.]MDB3899465.1 acetate--CoA ligase [Luminiphilus sp.]
MSNEAIYPVPSNFADAHISPDDYQQMYRQSLDDPESFWAGQAHEFLSWDAPWHTTCESDLSKGQARWFDGGQLNASVNCIDRHLPARAEQTAILWEGDNPSDSQHITYQALKDEVCRLANVMHDRGVTAGDRVCIYMPMVPEAAYAMLACTRIGAIHSVVFGGFSPEALKDRINDSGCRMVITADEGVRGGKTVPLKANVDQALTACPTVDTVIVLERTNSDIHWEPERDIAYSAATRAASTDFAPVSMSSEAPLFILYTSGSTGKPKGVLHTTGGYLLQAASTFKHVFDYREGEVFWCTADVGWVTGHSYIVYGPLCNGATTLMFEGIPTYPDGGRCWEIVDKHKVNTFFTAPTAIRALHALGDELVTKHSRKSLRIIGSVGEPINPEAWEWYHRVVGDSRCPIVDSWWQTETGAMMITPMPSAHAMKPGYASFPYFGVEPALLDEQGQEIHGEGAGYLVIKRSWPGQIRTVYGDHQRLIDTYFSTYPGYYFTGDGALRDADGYLRITGRVDDVLNISGHRMGTAEIESALVQHKDISEAAVVGYPHPIKGQGIYCYVTPVQGVEDTPELRAQLVQLCVREIGPIAKPDIIQWAPGLPKTRSGKIMRRILRKVAENELDNLGDTSTLADPSVVEQLIDAREGS